MTFSTTAQPLSYYVGRDELFDQLTDRYGCYFESMERHWKLMFRATLATYLVIRPIWNDEENGISCADSCIASAGGDDYNVWEEDNELVYWIRECCANLSEDDVEGLLQALSAQLRGTIA